MFYHSSEVLAKEAKQLARHYCRRNGIKLTKVRWSVAVPTLPEDKHPRLHVEWHGIARSGSNSGGQISVVI